MRRTIFIGDTILCGREYKTHSIVMDNPDTILAKHKTCLTIIGPPLLLLGTPEWMVKPALSNKVIFKVAKVLTYPVVAFVLFNVDFWLWHAPPLYNATLENQSIHIFEHLTFIFFGLLYWWPIFSTST